MYLDSAVFAVFAVFAEEIICFPDVFHGNYGETTAICKQPKQSQKRFCCSRLFTAFARQQYKYKCFWVANGPLTGLEVCVAEAKETGKMIPDGSALCNHDTTKTELVVKTSS